MKAEKSADQDVDLTDRDLADMFAAPVHYDDADSFAVAVTRKLQMRMWLRQWLVVLAGFIGGVYALAQFVRVPDWKLNGQMLYRRAAADTDQTLRAGAELVGGAGRDMMRMADSGGYLSFMQTPMFFALSFVLCVAILGLYYAYSQEEAL
jgi:hypothetical protein